MNQKLIIFFLFAFTGIIGCRKYNQGYTTVGPSSEKKWTVTTIAGDGRPVFADGPAPNASFRDPQSFFLRPVCLSTSREISMWRTSVIIEFGK